MPIAHFSRIVILQSLGAGDRFTGTSLHDDLEIFEAYHDLGLDIDLVNINNKEQLFQVLALIERRTLDEENYPLLHFEIHGSDDSSGLILSSGQYVSWDDLKYPLTNINIACRLNLIVVLAVCYGAHLMKIIQATDRAPCWGLIGPTKEISTGMVLAGFYKFYKTLLESGSGGSAFRSLVETSENITFENVYHFTNAEQLFRMVYSRYIKEECSPSSIDMRARRLYRKLKKDSEAKLISVGQLKRKLKQTQESYFSKYSDNFFMYDLYEENRSRFSVEYKDVSRADSL